MRFFSHTKKYHLTLHKTNMNLVNKLKLISFIIKRKIGLYPKLHYPLQRLFGHYYRLAVHHDTEIVIEGFPRSGNTFSVVAFEQAQNRKIKIAHHLHIPSQVLSGVRMGIPVVVLIRDPVDAICSLIVREPYLSINAALDDYIRFHKAIAPYKDKFLVAKFEDVTSNYGKVVHDLNIMFSKQYGEFVHTQENVDKVFNILDDLEPVKNKQSTNEFKVSRPSQERKVESRKIKSELTSPRFSKSLAEAKYLHSLLVKTKTRPK